MIDLMWLEQYRAEQHCAVGYSSKRTVLGSLVEYQEAQYLAS